MSDLDTMPRAGASILNWRELRSHVVYRQAGASAKGAAHWGRLLELIDARLAAAPSGQTPPQADTPWWLSEVKIGGFRGIADDQFVLHLEPRAGLTVLQAPNGTGKSTITEAVRAALWGAPARQLRQLWEPVDRAAGAAEAWVEVVLASGATQMSCRWSDSATPSATAIWTDASNERRVSVNDPDWQAALAAYTPVFSYTETQDRLSTAKDLKQHLEDLLALGPCFALLTSDVARRASDAKSSVDRLQKLKRQVGAELQRVDSRFTATGDSALPDVTMPFRFSHPKPDDWLTENSLDGDLATTTYTVPDDMPEAAQNCADELADALEALDIAERHLDTSLDEPVREHLVELHAHLDEHSSGPCPLCGQDSDWWTALSATAKTLEEWRQARQTVDRSAGRLASLFRDQIKPLVAAAAQLAVAPPDAMLEAAPPDSGRTRADRNRLADIGNAVRAPDFAALAQAVREASDHRRCWIAARREVVEPLVTAWRADGPIAFTANDWTQAQKNLTELRNDLRDARGDILRTEVADVLHRLLADAPLTLADLDLSGDALQLVGADGDPRKLGTLSAGQRNALVLAPLLRARADGPFAFMLIDDPVHAFDDLRVDLVSDELVRLARSRRVLVFTHDSWLKEVLRAKVPDADFRTLSRNSEGTVVASSRQEPWVSLLEDAETLLALADLPADLGKLPVAVRGLCRHAVDGAIRGLALRWAVLAKQDLRATLSALDKPGTTMGRLRHAERYGLAGRPSPASDARNACSAYLTGWNEAIHDTGGDSSTGLRDEVAAARRACQMLAAWGG